jgi:acetoacetate decarboxylase
MARLRWVKGEDEIRQSAENNPEFLESTVRSVRCVYETDPALVEAVIPRPLKPTDRPEVCVTFSHVAMHITPEFTFEIGSTIFGVRAFHDGVEGIYLLTMPMTTEQAVVPGRETYGEPKKIAEIDFQQEGDTVSSSVTRMGISYLKVSGRIGASLGAREFTEHAFCYKAQPSCEQGKGFDQDPLLVRLEWQHKQTQVNAVDGAELILTESPFDPVADLPVRRLVKAEYEVGSTQSNGRVLQSVPGEWLRPFLHGRYDEPSVQGIEIGG